MAPTGRLLRDLAVALKERGHEVTVICSAEAYNASSATSPADDRGVQIIRLGRPVGGRVSFVSKLVSYAKYYRLASKSIAGLRNHVDAMVAMTTPPFIGALAARHAAKAGIPFYLWCMDLYPEAMIANGNIRRDGLLYRLLRGFAQRERRGARAVISLGPDMSGLLSRDNGVHVVEIPVWSDLQMTPAVEQAARDLRRQRGWHDDELILLYSGNMGRAHRADAFAALAKCLKEQHRKFRMVMAGQGASRNVWQRAYGHLFEFIDHVDTTNVAAHLASADVHLVSQDLAWAGVVVPSKFQAACAMGRPVIYDGPSDSSVSLWIRQHNAGWVINAHDHDELARFAKELYVHSGVGRKRDAAAGLSAKYFSMSVNVNAIIQQIESGRLP